MLVEAGESNPRRKALRPEAYMLSFNSFGFASRGQNEQETQPASPMNLARTLQTERFGPAHCATPLAGRPRHNAQAVHEQSPAKAKNGCFDLSELPLAAARSIATFSYRQRQTLRRTITRRQSANAIRTRYARSEPECSFKHVKICWIERR